MSKRTLITGATSGIGKATASALAAAGHEVIMGCRNMSKAEAVRAEILSRYSHASIEILEVDLSSLESIRRFAGIFADRFARLDVLINNAGVFCDRPLKTENGFEMTMGVNYIGAFYLTELLISGLEKGENPRILQISSKAGLYGKLKPGKEVFRNHPHGFRAYSASKLAQLCHTLDLSEQLKPRGITVAAVHPGHVSTNIWRGETLLMRIMGRVSRKRAATPEAGAATGVALALADDIADFSGCFLEGENKKIALNRTVLDRDFRSALRTYTAGILSEAGFALPQRPEMPSL